MALRITLTKSCTSIQKDDSGRSVSYMWTDHDGDGNAVDNKEFLADYWRDSVKTNGSYENIYTLWYAWCS